MKFIDALRPFSGLDKTILDFADKANLVHFGFVDQSDDDHKIIRGMTVSNNHRDSHYCVGTYRGYDVGFVERTDSLKNVKTNTKHPHTWHIIEIDLKTSRDVPHVFIGRHTHSDTFYLQLFHKFPHLRQHRPGIRAVYDSSFLSDYRFYVAPTDAAEAEQYFTPPIVEQIKKHFGDLAIEVHDGALYIYSELTQISSATLLTMLENGIWLAHQIDERAR